MSKLEFKETIRSVLGGCFETGCTHYVEFKNGFLTREYINTKYGNFILKKKKNKYDNTKNNNSNNSSLFNKD
jgi:hypothetical protein